MVNFKITMASLGLTFVKDRVAMLPGYESEMWTPEVEKVVVPFVESMLSGSGDNAPRLFVAIAQRKAQAASADDVPFELLATTTSGGDFGAGTTVKRMLYVIRPTPSTDGHGPNNDNGVEEKTPEAILSRATWGMVNGHSAKSLLLRTSTVYAPAILARKSEDDDGEEDDDEEEEGNDAVGRADTGDEGVEFKGDEASQLSDEVATPKKKKGKTKKKSKKEDSGAGGSQASEGTSDLVPALHRLLASLTEMVGNDEAAAAGAKANQEAAAVASSAEGGGGGDKAAAAAAAAAGGGGGGGAVMPGSGLQRATVLYVPSTLARGPDLDDEAAFLRLAKDSSLVQQLESIVVQWTRQVRELLVSHDATIDSDGLGPREEIAFWSRATAELEATCQQLKRVDVARAMAVLEVRGGRTSERERWKEKRRKCGEREK